MKDINAILDERIREVVMPLITDVERRLRQEFYDALRMIRNEPPSDVLISSLDVARRLGHKTETKEDRRRAQQAINHLRRTKQLAGVRINAKEYAFTHGEVEQFLESGTRKRKA